MCIWSPKPELEEVIESNIDELDQLTDALNDIILDEAKRKEAIKFPIIKQDDLLNRRIH